MEIGPELLRVFGLSADSVRRFSVSCAVDEPAILIVEYFGDLNHDTKELETIIKTFELTEKDG